jgi:hypothetical protein
MKVPAMIATVWLMRCAEEHGGFLAVAAFEVFNHLN